MSTHEELFKKSRRKIDVNKWMNKKRKVRLRNIRRSSYH